jgi:hypothetical protein
MKRLDTLQEVEILVSRMVEGELVEGAELPKDLNSQSWLHLIFLVNG